jgi:hypothetical protein
MFTAETSHSSVCAAARRHKHRRPQTRPQRGLLDIRTPDIVARLLDEGVPAADIDVVAAEVTRCIRFIRESGNDVLYIRLHPWTLELIERYGDKLVTLMMTTRGSVTR